MAVELAVVDGGKAILHPRSGRRNSGFAASIIIIHHLNSVLPLRVHSHSLIAQTFEHLADVLQIRVHNPAYSTDEKPNLQETTVQSKWVS